MAKSQDEDSMRVTKRLMASLVRMKPKPHEDMKARKKREPAEADPRSSRQKRDNQSKPE
jgi:hypothetical protein